MYNNVQLINFEKGGEDYMNGLSRKVDCFADYWISILKLDRVHIMNIISDELAAGDLLHVPAHSTFNHEKKIYCKHKTKKAKNDSHTP